MSLIYNVYNTCIVGLTLVYKHLVYLFIGFLYVYLIFAFQAIVASEIRSRKAIYVSVYVDTRRTKQKQFIPVFIYRTSNIYLGC
jgi:hypothetical protein